MGKKLLALVKWKGGEDDKTFTSGVPVTWIRSFDYERYTSGEDGEKVFVIEWHDKAKEPPGGWNCFQGFVVSVSDRLKVLEQKLNMLEGTVSPRKVCALSEISPENTLSMSENISATTSSCVMSADKTQSPKKTPENNNKDTQKGKQRRLQFDDDISESEQKDESFSISDISEIQPNSAVMKHLITSNMDMVKQMGQLCHALKRQRKRKRTSSQSSESSDDTEEERMVRVGAKKFGVRVTANQWRCAKAQVTYTAMGISLLTALFPADVLRKSNLKGGKSKIKGSESSHVLKALDPNILQAIYDAVQTAHPKAFNKTLLGVALNNKMHTYRNPRKRTETS